MATPNIVPRADQEGGLGTAAKSWGKLFIENATAGGTAAATISNLDIDQVALDVNANNTTANVIDVVSTALTTGNVMNVDCNGLTTGSAINLDIDDAGTATNKSLIKIDYDKAGALGDTETNVVYGLDINMADAATNHANSTTNSFGVSVVIDAASDQGNINQTGYYANLTDGDVGNTTGFKSRVEDGGIDFKAESTADTGDYFSIATTTHGATTLTTVDDNAAAAHFEIAADGNITLDPAGTIALEAATVVTGAVTGTNYRTIWVDAGSMVPTATNGAAAGTEELATNDVMVDYFAFDSSTDEKVQFKMVMPEQWDLGTIRARFYWKSSNTDTGDVAWFIQSVAHADSGALDTAFGTAVSVHTADDVGLGTDNDLHITAGTTNMTVDGSYM